MSDRVVVTGLGVVSPVGLNTKTTWANLLAGKSGVDRITAFDVIGMIVGPVHGQKQLGAVPPKSGHNGFHLSRIPGRYSPIGQFKTFTGRAKHDRGIC